VDSVEGFFVGWSEGVVVIYVCVNYAFRLLVYGLLVFSVDCISSSSLSCLYDSGKVLGVVYLTVKIYTTMMATPNTYAAMN